MMSDYMAWADDTAEKMRAYYDEHRPLTLRERLFGRRDTSLGCVADELMLGLMNVALAASRARTTLNEGTSHGK